VRMNRGVGLLMYLFLAAVVSVAQSPNGTISGIVLDPSGGVIIGANVLVINNATGVEYPGRANSEGYYVVPNIPPGTYRIQVSNSGFKTIIKPDIVIHVEDALAINFTLPIGAASEIVTVEGGAPLVNTEDAAVSTVIDRNFVEKLPLNGRSFNTLLQITPGVVIAPSNSGEPGQFSISGQRTNSNNLTVDGVSANFGVNSTLVEAGTGGAQAFSVLGGTSSLVSVDALQEFRIETSSFAPEFGRSPGGQIALTTRSGTNSFHGGAFDYFRNTVMDANDWFANSNKLPRAPEHHNDFGGFVGGPIVRDRTFFFISYEGARLDLPETSSAEVPSAFARSTAPSELAPYLVAYPQPNNQTVVPGVYTSIFTGSYANRGALDATSIRVDHTVNDRFSIFGRYNYAPSNTVTRGGTGISPSSVGSTSVDTQTLTVGGTLSFDSETANSIRGNYSTQMFSLSYLSDSFGGATPLSASVFLGGLPESATYAYFYTYDTALLLSGPYGRNQTKQMNFVDDFSKTKGKHHLKVGGDYRGIFLNAQAPPHKLFQTSPSVQTFLSSAEVNLGTETTVASRILSQAASLYGQDTWKVTSRLTVTYGLRWELSPAPLALGETTLASWKDVNNLAEISLAPIGTAPWHSTYGNVAPRIGLAYDVNGKGSLVVRVGGGIFYDLSAGSSAQLAKEFPNLTSTQHPGVPIPLTNVESYLPVISLEPPYPIVVGVDPDLRLPRSYQWNVAVDKALGQDLAVTATYVGQAGRDLFRTNALYAPNPDFSSEFLLESNDARSNYDALQLQLRGNVGSRLKALLNYTFSHSLDNISNDAVAGLSGTVISGANDYASSDFDVRHSFSGAISYSLPAFGKSGALAFVSKDWELSGVLVARSGFPFNAQIYNFSLDPGGFALTRPDRVPGVSAWVYGAQCQASLGGPCAGGKGLNPAAFIVPSEIRQGTEGRNDIVGFGLTQVDLSTNRRFRIGEKLSVMFQADAFNVLNHPNFTNPQAFVQYGSFYLQSQQMLNQGLGGLNPLFQQGGPRSLQLSLKLAF